MIYDHGVLGVRGVRGVPGVLGVPGVPGVPPKNSFVCVAVKTGEARSASLVDTCFGGTTSWLRAFACSG